MSSYPTLHEIKTAADEYWQVWQQLLGAAPALRKVVGAHSPTALGWKVEGDLAPLEAAAHVYELGDSLFCGPVNGERAILTVHKAQAVALDALQDIKILQRRPSRPDDRLGPDSLDLLLEHGLPKAAMVQAAVTKLEVVCEEEHNPSIAWLSLTYLGHEFKLKEHRVWEACVRDAERLV